MNNKKIGIASKVKDLCITFSNDLTFTEHINEIYNKGILCDFGFLKFNFWEFRHPYHNELLPIKLK